MSWKTGVEKLLAQRLHEEVQILSDHPLGGGSINDARVVQTTGGQFFVKINSASRYPGMFEKEAKGLALLSETNVIALPGVIGFGEDNKDAFLVLNFIKSATKTVGFWLQFGEALAALHRNTGNYFGLDHDNYIGSLPQRNRQHDNWSGFFRDERLEPMVAMAFNSGRIDRSMIRHFENFYNRMDNLFPEEPPALIHGDLWGGNFMVGESGEPVIIDPAVYYGHREMDLGMSQLFGGFDKPFYDAYNRAYPLKPGWQERLAFCNLYPLMVHVNLFGGGYAGSVKSIIERF